MMTNTQNFGRNRFKTRLNAGDQMAGIWCSTGSATVAEILANTNIDWLMFDTEHAAIEVADLLPMLQATEGLRASRLVRPAWNDRVLIKRVLDLGARNLLIPFIQDAKEAREAIVATRYPPDGVRGVAGRMRASRYGMERGYLHKAQTEICVIVQLETQTAINNIEEIAAVEGVDALFVGPSDLAAAIGHLGNPAHPDVQNAIHSAAQCLKNTGKPAGILATNNIEAETYFNWGFQFVSISSDIALLTEGAQAVSLKIQMEED